MTNDTVQESCSKANSAKNKISLSWRVGLVVGPYFLAPLVYCSIFFLYEPNFSWKHALIFYNILLLLVPVTLALISYYAPSYTFLWIVGVIWLLYKALAIRLLFPSRRMEFIILYTIYFGFLVLDLLAFPFLEGVGAGR
jgi:hypothetical protein